MGRVCSSKWQLVRKERIKARIPLAPPEPMRISTERPQALSEAKPTINIKEDVGIPWGNKWGCVLNKRVGGGGPGSLEVPQTDHGKMEKMRPSHYGDAVEIADDNLIWNQLESFPSSAGLGVQHITVAVSRKCTYLLGTECCCWCFESAGRPCGTPVHAGSGCQRAWHC